MAPERSGGDAASARARRLPLPGPAETVLPADFYARPADRVARDLLGALLVSEVGGARCVAEIVETEAYVGPDDEASHAHIRFGVTPRNAPMYGPPGIAYVYRIYGIHWCFNAVTGPDGFPAAILVRAARPLAGMAAMRARRGPGRPDRALLRGPGNLCSALGIDGERNRQPLDRPPLRILRGEPVGDERVARGPRIGISRGVDLPLRFWLRGSPWVSAPAGPAAEG